MSSTIQLETDVTLNGESLSITVYEDLDADGQPENQQTVSVANGVNNYSLRQLAGSLDANYWFEESYTSSGTSAVTINAVDVVQKFGTIAQASATSASGTDTVADASIGNTSDSTPTSASTTTQTATGIRHVDADARQNGLGVGSTRELGGGVLGPSGATAETTPETATASLKYIVTPTPTSATTTASSAPSQASTTAGSLTASTTTSQSSTSTTTATSQATITGASAATQAASASTSTTSGRTETAGTTPSDAPSVTQTTSAARAEPASTTSRTAGPATATTAGSTPASGTATDAPGAGVTSTTSLGGITAGTTTDTGSAPQTATTSSSSPTDGSTTTQTVEPATTQTSASTPTAAQTTALGAPSQAASTGGRPTGGTTATTQASITSTTTSPASVASPTAGPATATASTHLNAPSNVTATVDANDQITVSWDDTSGSEDNYHVQLSRDGSTYSDPGTHNNNPTPGADTTSVSLTPDSDFSYDRQIGIDSSFKFRVRAETEDVNSSWTTSGTAYTDPIPPHNPSVTRTSNNGEPAGETVRLDWSNKTDIYDHVEVQYRKDTGSGYGSWTHAFTDADTRHWITVSKYSWFERDARYQFRLRTVGPDGKTSKWVYSDYGNQDNLYLADDFEDQDLVEWNTGNEESGSSSFDDGESGIHSGSYGTLSSADEGTYYVTLGDSDYIEANPGDLSGESDVIVKCSIYTYSNDASNERATFKWYDGTGWHELEAWAWEYNRQGWVEAQVRVPSSYLGSGNKLRIVGEGGRGGGDHMAVDRVVVSDICHEYTIGSAPSSLSSSTPDTGVISLDWTNNHTTAFDAYYIDIDWQEDWGDGDTNAGQWLDYNTAPTSTTFDIPGSNDPALENGKRYNFSVFPAVAQHRHGSLDQRLGSDSANGVVGQDTTLVPGTPASSAITARTADDPTITTTAGTTPTAAPTTPATSDPATTQTSSVTPASTTATASTVNPHTTQTSVGSHTGSDATAVTVDPATSRTVELTSTASTAQSTTVDPATATTPTPLVDGLGTGTLGDTRLPSATITGRPIEPTIATGQTARATITSASTTPTTGELTNTATTSQATATASTTTPPTAASSTAFAGYPYIQFGTRFVPGTIDGDTVTVNESFDESFEQPVIVSWVLERRDPANESVHSRVKNVTSSGFDLFLQEPDNDSHPPERVAWLAVDAAKSLPGELQAGTVTTDVLRRNGSVTVDLPEAYDANPGVLHGLQTYNNADFMATSVPSGTVSPSSFDIAQENLETGHATSTEDIAWIALPQGATNLAGHPAEVYVSANTVNGVDNGESVFTYNRTYDSTPYVVASQQTLDGGNGTYARMGGTYDSSSIGIVAEEDQVGDSERSHTSEVMAFVAAEVYGTATTTTASVSPKTAVITEITAAPDTTPAQSYVQVDPIVDEGIQGYWSFDAQHAVGDVAIDPTGTADAVARGAQFGATGHHHDGVSLDGVDDYLAIRDFTYTTANEITELTVSAWVKLNADGTIVGYDRSEYFRADSGNFATNEPNTSTNDLSPATSINDGTWHHIVFWYNASSSGDNKRIYIDNTMDASAAAPHNGNGLGTGATRYGFIGDDSEASTFDGSQNGLFPDGTLDDVRVYHRALSEAEIDQLYSTQRPHYSATTANTSTTDPAAITPSTVDAIPTDPQTTYTANVAVDTATGDPSPVTPVTSTTSGPEVTSAISTSPTSGAATSTTTQASVTAASSTTQTADSVATATGGDVVAGPTSPVSASATTTTASASTPSPASGTSVEGFAGATSTTAGGTVVATGTATHGTASSIATTAGTAGSVLGGRPVLTDGLVSYWSFESETATIADSYGTNDGSNAGGTYDVGYTDSGLWFETGNYAEVPDDSSLHLSDFTVAGWIYIDESTSDWQPIVGRGLNGNRNYGLFVNSGGGTRIHYSFKNTNGNWESFNSSANLNTGEWYFIAMTYDHSAFTFYVNGSEDSSHTVSTDPVQTADPLRFAHDEDDSYGYYLGGLDEFYVFKKGLGQSQIQELYDAYASQTSGERAVTSPRASTAATTTTATIAPTTTTGTDVPVEPNTATTSPATPETATGAGVTTDPATTTTAQASVTASTASTRTAASSIASTTSPVLRDGLGTGTLGDATLPSATVSTTPTPGRAKLTIDASPTAGTSTATPTSVTTTATGGTPVASTATEQVGAGTAVATSQTPATAATTATPTGAGQTDTTSPVRATASTTTTLTGASQTTTTVTSPPSTIEAPPATVAPTTTTTTTPTPTAGTTSTLGGTVATSTISGTQPTGATADSLALDPGTATDAVVTATATTGTPAQSAPQTTVTVGDYRLLPQSSGDYVEADTIAPSGSFTISFVVEGDFSTSTDTYPKVFRHHSSSTSAAVGFWGRNDVPDTFFRLDSDSTSRYAQHTYDNEFPEPTRITFVYDDSVPEARFYKDGTKVKTVSLAGDVITLDGSHTVGTPNTVPANAPIDDFRWYGRALADSEVEPADIHMATEGLTLWYLFNTPDTPYVIDRSGNHLTGSVQGTPAFIPATNTARATPTASAGTASTTSAPRIEPATATSTSGRGKLTIDTSPTVSTSAPRTATTQTTTTVGGVDASTASSLASDGTAVATSQTPPTAATTTTPTGTGQSTATAEPVPTATTAMSPTAASTTTTTALPQPVPVEAPVTTVTPGTTTTTELTTTAGTATSLTIPGHAATTSPVGPSAMTTSVVQPDVLARGINGSQTSAQTATAPADVATTTTVAIRTDFALASPLTPASQASTWTQASVTASQITPFSAIGALKVPANITDVTTTTRIGDGFTEALPLINPPYAISDTLAGWLSAVTIDPATTSSTGTVSTSTPATAVTDTAQRDQAKTAVISAQSTTGATASASTSPATATTQSTETQTLAVATPTTEPASATATTATRHAIVVAETTAASTTHTHPTSRVTMTTTPTDTSANVTQSPAEAATTSAGTTSAATTTSQEAGSALTARSQPASTSAATTPAVRTVTAGSPTTAPAGQPVNASPRTVTTSGASTTASTSRPTTSSSSSTLTAASTPATTQTSSTIATTATTTTSTPTPTATTATPGRATRVATVASQPAQASATAVDATSTTTVASLAGVESSAGTGIEITPSPAITSQSARTSSSTQSLQSTSSLTAASTTTTSSTTPRGSTTSTATTSQSPSVDTTATSVTATRSAIVTVEPTTVSASPATATAATSTATGTVEHAIPTSRLGEPTTASTIQAEPGRGTGTVTPATPATAVTSTAPATASTSSPTTGVRHAIVAGASTTVMASPTTSPGRGQTTIDAQVEAGHARARTPTPGVVTVTTPSTTQSTPTTPTVELTSTSTPATSPASSHAADATTATAGTGHATLETGTPMTSTGQAGAMAGQAVQTVGTTTTAAPATAATTTASVTPGTTTAVTPELQLLVNSQPGGSQAATQPATASTTLTPTPTVIAGTSTTRRADVETATFSTPQPVATTADGVRAESLIGQTAGGVVQADATTHLSAPITETVVFGATTATTAAVRRPTLTVSATPELAAGVATARTPTTQITTIASPTVEHAEATLPTTAVALEAMVTQTAGAPVPSESVASATDGQPTSATSAMIQAHEAIEVRTQRVDLSDTPRTALTTTDVELRGDGTNTVDVLDDGQGATETVTDYDRDNTVAVLGRATQATVLADGRNTARALQAGTNSVTVSGDETTVTVRGDETAAVLLHGGQMGDVETTVDLTTSVGNFVTVLNTS